MRNMMERVQMVRDRQHSPSGLRRHACGLLPSGVVRVPFTDRCGGVFTLVDVAYIADFPRGADGQCAFCHGDPCAERSSPGEPIARLRQRRGRLFEACPMCEGRPS